MFYSGYYVKALTFLNSTPFGKADPLFSKDIGYYIFQRPFLLSSYELLLNLSLFLIVYAVAYYYLTLILFGQSRYEAVLRNTPILRHLIIQTTVFIAIKIFHFQFLKEDLLYSNVVESVGASYVDVNVWMKYLTVAPFLLVAILICAVFLLFRKKYIGVLITIAAYPAVWAITLLIAAVVQFIVVNPNEYSLERPFIEHNIKNTREAFGLDKIKDFNFPDMKVLSPEIITDNRNIIDNVRVVDIGSTIINNVQLQSNTNFYTFAEGDILIYNVNGKDTPVFVAAREMDPNKLPDKTYINTRYKFTHGYGIVMNSINKITPVGQVEYVMSGLRLRSEDPDLTVREPRIYYGEIVKDEQVVVNANGINEIDYDGNTETRYSGTGGIHLNFLNRLLFAIDNADLNLITSGYAKGATLLLNRNITERAQKAFPFLLMDPDPDIVLTDEGRLVWVIDAFTYTNMYPYAERFYGVNYIKNSLKVLIDAYDGTTEYYVIDKDDPMIQTYSKVYPGVFKDEPLPVSTQKHIRYPEILFNIRSEALKQYHLNETESSIFYSKQDLWAVAKRQVAIRSEKTEPMEAFYNLLRLPGELGQKEELILMLPYTPSGENKNNMVSWLAVRNDYEHYGETIIFNFPKNMNVFGPYQVEMKINQIDTISTNITLWGQGGSEVYKGNLLVIPIEDSVLYVEPIYIRAAGVSSIPEVRQIVVGYQAGDEFIYGIGSNLDNALKDLFKISNWDAQGLGAGEPGTAGTDGAAGTSVVIGANGAQAPEQPSRLTPQQQLPDGAGTANGGTIGANGGTGAEGATGANGGAAVVEDREQVIRDLIDKYDEVKSRLDEMEVLIDMLK
jgi:uncharacterized membrane protein (UPF0182 family)